MCFIRLRHSSVYNEGVHLCVEQSEGCGVFAGLLTVSY